jgi:hypothetical protein
MSYLTSAKVYQSGGYSGRPYHMAVLLMFIKLSKALLT